MKNQTTDTMERARMITDIRAFFVYLRCESVVQKLRSIDFSNCPTTAFPVHSQFQTQQLFYSNQTP